MSFAACLCRSVHWFITLFCFAFVTCFIILLYMQKEKKYIPSRFSKWYFKLGETPSWNVSQERISPVIFRLFELERISFYFAKRDDGCLPTIQTPFRRSKDANISKCLCSLFFAFSMSLHLVMWHFYFSVLMSVSVCFSFIRLDTNNLCVWFSDYTH